MSVKKFTPFDVSESCNKYISSLNNEITKLARKNYLAKF